MYTEFSTPPKAEPFTPFSGSAPPRRDRRNLEVYQALSAPFYATNATVDIATLHVSYDRGSARGEENCWEAEKDPYKPNHTKSATRPAYSKNRTPTQRPCRKPGTAPCQACTGTTIHTGKVPANITQPKRTSEIKSIAHISNQNQSSSFTSRHRAVALAVAALLVSSDPVR